MQKHNIKILLTQEWKKVLKEGIKNKDDRVKLSEEINQKLFDHVFEQKSIFAKYCKGNIILQQNDYGVNFDIIKPTIFQRKTVPLQNKLPNFEINVKCLSWKELLSCKVSLGSLPVTPENVVWWQKNFYDESIKQFDREAFQMMENSITKNNEITIDFNTISELEIYNQLINEATKLTKFRDKNGKIDLIDRDKIVISVDPNIFNKIAQVELLSNRVAKIFEDNQYFVSTIGGFKIMSNPFLNESKAIIGTIFSGFGSVKVIAVNVGKIVALSEDMAIYFEAACVKDINENYPLIAIKQK
ncbi:hypothetical protein [[Mycoplasma] anseris]|uniref:Uncharacterized protein n=1 Tax=[Mycoplasma] anseris TaxID=92400 RepID=A0A2Z4NDJ1_9BACT|nr:hypothetical protein [[Mycoplasma] anseris]AWX69576.1 hypothetical protein DP065_02315 [[Mycoplasma] anseris]